VTGGKHSPKCSSNVNLQTTRSNCWCWLILSRLV
jgi:hypothetical protein